MPLLISWIVIWEILGKPWLSIDGRFWWATGHRDILEESRIQSSAGQQESLEHMPTLCRPYLEERNPLEKNPQHKLKQENLTQPFRKKRCSTAYRENFIIHQHHFLFQRLLGGWRFPEQPAFLLCLGHAVHPEGKNRQKSSENLNFSSRHIWPASTIKDFFHCTEILTVSHKL